VRYLALAILLVSSVCSGQTAQTAQTAQPPATADELKYLRFLLLNVASLDHSPDAVAAYESALVLQFGFSTQESAVVHSAGQTMKTTLAQLRQSTQALLAGKTALSPTDIATLQSLNEQREQTIVTLANQILNSVSSLTASRLRAPGHIMAAAINK